MKPTYSGKNSKKFWNKINTQPACVQNELYSLGIALQNLEDFVLKRFNDITNKKRK